MAAQSQAQAKSAHKSEVSRAQPAQKKDAKRQINPKGLHRKDTNAAPAYLQAKLNVSTPDDPHEREADQVADNVLRMPAQRAQEGADRQLDRASLKPGITPLNRAISRVISREGDSQASRMEASDTSGASRSEEASRTISRDSLKPGEMAINRASLKPGEDAIQRKGKGDAAEADSGGATDKVENRIDAKRGQGEKLPDGVRGDMESRFGRDFSAVRIHVDKDAAEMSREIEAKAFTVGNDIFFGSGKFDANSDEGRRLLAHELTHVAQQQSSQNEQEDGQQASRSESKVNRWSLTGWLADKAWGILKRVAPSGLYNLVREVYDKGIFGYLKEKISDAVSYVFDGLKQGADVLTNFFASFGRMAKTAKDIIKALMAGNCKPLFAAVKVLKDTISEAAGDAWAAIKDFFAPIGAFFSDLWSSWGAPVLDWLKKTAGSVWTWLKDLGKTIWNWTKPVRDYAGSAWSWLKDKLGFGGGGGGQGDSEGGIMGWIKEKTQSAWAAVKEVMDPVIKPVKKFAAKIADILPIKAILNLRETVQGWLNNAASMGQAMGEDGSGVADQQISLREQILPAVIKTMKSVRDSLSSTGLWIGEKIGGLVSDFTGFMKNLRDNTLLKGLAYLLGWVETGIASLGNWAKDTVQSLLNWLGDGLVKLAEFIEPVLNALKQVADTILNLLGKLPDLILGPIWRAIPKCIRDPLKDFVLNQILARIPFFKQLIAVKDAWEQIKATGLLILKQVFVDGDLFGALWTLFKAILRIFKLPVQLVTNIIVKAAQSLGAIIAAPLDFLMNILRAMALGFKNFFGNILTHLLTGAMQWLFGAVTKAGLTPPTEFTAKAIFTFVLDVLGLSMELVWKKLAEKIGQDKVDKFKEKLEYATGALEWIKVAVTEGPASMWEKLTEKLSELWNMLLNGVVEWINTRIIAWASRWLLSLLDVTGIMPIINATIAIYKAIQSFMEHLRAMLEIVNTVLNGVADLAAGAIESAAKFLEDALVAAIPIVIGFLANQAGFGNIAEKIAEILCKIRLKVEEAVGWLVGKVVDTVKAFVDRVTAGVKAGVQAIKEWWKARKKFNTKDGGDHHLYFSGSRSAAKLMVASDNPHTIESVAKNKIWNGVEIFEADSGLINAQLSKANKAQAELDADSSNNQAQTDLDSALQVISNVLEKYTLSSEPTEEIHYPSGENGDPVLINWYKVAADYTDLTINNTTYGFGGGANQANICGESLGVNLDNLKTVGSEWPKGTSNVRAQANSLRGCLQRNGASVKNIDEDAEDLSIGTPDNPDNYQIDHVRDLNLGGPDKETNIWPLRSSKNAGANTTQYQWVKHKGVAKKVGDLPVGTRIKVDDVKTTGDDHNTTQATPYCGKDNADCNVSGEAVPIVWYKSANEYATITLKTAKKGKPGEFETRAYSIGQKMDLTGVKKVLQPLQTHNNYRNPLGLSWSISKSDSRHISGLVSQNLRNYYKNYKAQEGNRRAQVNDSDGTELTPRDLQKETQVDHVFDLSMGGLDQRDNLWPIRGDRNNYAAKNGTQFVAYVKNQKKTISAASSIPNEFKVKVVKIGGATTQKNPAAYNELKQKAKADSQS